MLNHRQFVNFLSSTYFRGRFNPTNLLFLSKEFISTIAIALTNFFLLFAIKEEEEKLYCRHKKKWIRVCNDSERERWSHKFYFMFDENKVAQISLLHFVPAMSMMISHVWMCTWKLLCVLNSLEYLTLIFLIKIHDKKHESDTTWVLSLPKKLRGGNSVFGFFCTKNDVATPWKNERFFQFSYHVLKYR